MGDWVTTIFDGFAGGFTGAAGAFVAAIYIVERQAKSDRRLAAEERRADAVRTASLDVQDLIIATLRARRLAKNGDREGVAEFLGRLHLAMRRISTVMTVVDPELSNDFLVQTVAYLSSLENSRSPREVEPAIGAYADLLDWIGTCLAGFLAFPEATYQGHRASFGEMPSPNPGPQ